MATNTRFNPTVNGPLHIGHLYLALVNAHEAQSVGGKFIVRFDDNHPHMTNVHGWAQTIAWRDAMKHDLGQYVTPDYWTSEVDYSWRLEQMAEMFKQERQPFRTHRRWSATIHGSDMSYYPYAAVYTAEKVYLDMLEGITYLVRGIDLISEFCLYEYFRIRAGIPYVSHIYMPRLQASSGGLLSPVTKTEGNCKLADMTAKHGVDGVMAILRDACLVDREGPFSIANIKSQPRMAV